MATKNELDAYAALRNRIRREALTAIINVFGSAALITAGLGAFVMSATVDLTVTTMAAFLSPTATCAVVAIIAYMLNREHWKAKDHQGITRLTRPRE